jgi:hypothetical protein
VITCLLRGTEYCLYDTLRLAYKPDPAVVYPAVESVVHRDWDMTKRYFEKGSIARGNYP